MIELMALGLIAGSLFAGLFVLLFVVKMAVRLILLPLLLLKFFVLGILWLVIGPILFIAGATGFAPVKSILEDAFGRGVQRPMRLYWGVRQRKDLYLLELAQRWQREHANFQVVPVLSEPLPEDHWPARTGLVHEAMLADYDDLSGFEVYVCGSLKMVETAVPAFLAHGLQEEACFSDAFLPAAAPVANA